MYNSNRADSRKKKIKKKAKKCLNSDYRKIK